MYTLFIKQLTNHLAGNGRETFQELRECVIVLMGAGGFGFYGGQKGAGGTFYGVMMMRKPTLKTRW